MAKSIIGSIVSSGDSSESSLMKLLMETKDFQKQKMLSEVPAPLVPTMSVLGMIQRRYHSEVLKQYGEEYLAWQKSRDRQFLGEIIEVALGISRNAGIGPDRDE